MKSLNHRLGGPVSQGRFLFLCGSFRLSRRWRTGLMSRLHAVIAGDVSRGRDRIQHGEIGLRNEFQDARGRYRDDSRPRQSDGQSISILGGNTQVPDHRGSDGLPERSFGLREAHARRVLARRISLLRIDRHGWEAVLQQCPNEPVCGPARAGA